MQPQEPPDGDFVAYLEALQRESAARIGVQSTASASAAPSSTAPGSTAPTFDPREAEQLLARLAHSPASARFISGAVATAIGGLLLLYALVGSGGGVSWLVGIGLLVWALPRMRRAAREFPGADRQLARRIAATFGSRPPHP